jgi:hypothetical protein
MIIKEDATISINDMVLNDIEKFISKKLDENSLWVNDVSVYESVETPDAISIDIEVNDGDWKHEHKRLDYLLYDILYAYNPKLADYCEKIAEDITDEDGSDTYSSIHRYEISV